ncbi:WD40-repeat-containing domain protein [Delphinella strobiligena]|nr:WD40-repeat-containing domain protein [Delphinella strobiligena]
MSVHPSRQAYVEEAGQEDTEMTYDLSNVPLDTDYYMPTEGGGNEKASAVLAQFTRKRNLAAVAVPTDDVRVRARLRELGEPITLFGERPEDRRDRLRELLYAAQQDGGEDVAMGEAAVEDEEDESNQEFYTEGPDELLQARKDIAKYSLPRSQRRVHYQRLESTIPLQRHVDHRQNIRDRLSGFELFGSQIAGERPVSMARFSPNSDKVAAGNWGGTIKLLDVPNLNEIAVLRGHTAQVSGISWFPGSTLPGSSVSENSVNLASGGGEGNIHLWSLTQDTPLATLSGHSGRVCRTEFHPSGKYLASASYDTTWRLWDVETTTELLLQEGHSHEAYTVAFNTDGSLLASAGLDSIACLWDLRSGRRVLYLESHIKPIYGLDWSPDGYRIMTGSGDGFAKCWDIRQMRETASIGAHKGGVTDLRWFKGVDGPSSGKNADKSGEDLLPKKAGTFFVSAGFDRNVKIFSADDWALCKTLSGHSGHVLSTDVTADGRWIVSSSYDRTVKLWARDDMTAL